MTHTRRIMGIETEYGITATTPGTANHPLSPDEIARVLFRPINHQWGSSNIFTHNASRLYLDVGSHPEIATAECDNLTQLITYDRAGDEIINNLATQAEQTLKTEGINTNVYLFKNNLDSAGNSYGCHENYLIDRKIVLKTLGHTLLPFLITRQIICGAGNISPDGTYQFSQRADHVWEGVSSATTRSRPIINTRDEAHADTHRYRRLHIIVGDSNLAEPTLALKIGSTTLILEMIEAGFPNLPHLEFANNMAAIRTISRDLTGQTPIPTTTGTTTTALELQQRYLDAATEWLTHREETGGTTNTELTHTLNLWHTTLNAIKTGDITTIDHDIDWAIKLNLLTTYHTTLGLKPHNYNHPKLHQLNLAYHDIRPGRGLHRLLETKNRINRITTPETVTHATTNPPPTTRAALRGTFLHHATYHHAPFAVDWLRLKINQPEPQIVELTDPFANTDPRVDELIKYLETHSHYYQEP